MAEVALDTGKIVVQTQKRHRSVKVVRRRTRAMGLVRMKMKKLQRLIPGGRGLQPDRLFLQTADYIMFLRSQVNALKALSNLCEP